MSKNPFSKQKGYEPKPNRNSFPLSFANNLTMNYGGLYPVLTIPTLPGDSFNINVASALRFMPLLFPVQTRCRAHIHFFYQRNKNLWTDFPDFIAGNKTYKTPSLANKRADTFPHVVQSTYNTGIFGTGKLGDYLNLPTTYSGLQGSSIELSPINKAFIAPTSSNFDNGPILYSSQYSGEELKRLLDKDPESWRELSDTNNDFLRGYGCTYNGNNVYQGFSIDFAREHSVDVIVPSGYKVYFALYYGNDNVPTEVVVAKDVVGMDSVTASFKSTLKKGAVIYMFSFSNYIPEADFPLGNISGSIREYSDISSGDFYTFSNSLPLSALPFRCYESIYNSFYRDSRNNPLVDSDGNPVYNKFLLNSSGGLDTTPYQLRFRNWELDQFTSCVQSPQQGVAPLVGISSTGKATFLSDDGKVTLQAKTADDNDTIVGFEVNSNIPDSVARAVVSTATQGISINDFRAVNSYQRWLETNIRRGLKYRDQIKARWGVDLEERTMDMPEFLGGISFDVDVNTVSQTTETENAPLGSYAGQMTAFGKSEHSITHYCDDYGFIMAIMSVIPTPVYSSSLPRHFSDFSPLDFYSPEFAHIGMQPVTYRDLCPLLMANTSKDRVFGYQRPWWQYLNKVDEVHGDFRTTLHNFVLNREYDIVPELDENFTVISPSSLNNIFATEDGDKILGQVYFDIEAKRPIPQISIPSIS